ncbi:MAG: hypothetical protein AAB093_00930 [Nitrospirota bacterium]
MDSSLALMAVVLVLPGCGLLGTRQVTYLEQATDRATQEEVLQEFGEPVEQRTLDDGITELTFRYSGVSMAMMMDVTDVWCVEYVLTFDTDKILRNWVRQDCPKK